MLFQGPWNLADFLMPKEVGNAPSIEALPAILLFLRETFLDDLSKVSLTVITMVTCIRSLSLTKCFQMDVVGAFEALRQAEIIANAGQICPPKRNSDYRKVAIFLVSQSFFNHAHDEGRLDEVNFNLISLLH